MFYLIVTDKVWEPGQEIADLAGRLQLWWIQKWTDLVPRLMAMKADVENAEKENSDPSADGNEDCPTSYVHNERGEDFQDQIGMPDEENMRSWSHHHTTDTVDGKLLSAIIISESISHILLSTLRMLLQIPSFVRPCVDTIRFRLCLVWK